MLKLHEYNLQSPQQRQRDWNPTTALEDAEAKVDFKLRYQGQQGQRGLGLIPVERPLPNSGEYRQMVTETISDEEEHKQLVR